MNATHGQASPLPEGRADGREALARQVRAAVIAGPMANMVRYGHLEAAADAVVAAILAAPVVAVPEAGERACDCPTNEAGDIRCHVCREYVNKRCWNCHTPRGEGPCPNPAPAALTDAEKAEMVAALDDLNGPVGVQPEPAEPSEWADPQLERQMKAAWKEADRHRAQPAGPGIPAHCGVCFTAWPCEVAQDRPAVPVVHPEPGDRAETDGLLHKGTSDFKLADALLPLLLLWGGEDEADEDVDQYDITNAAINHLRQRPPAEFALLFPSQVAAAVAAVRADREAEVAGLRTQLAALEEREALREKPWQERGVWALMKRAEPAMRDELMAAWAVRDETLASAAVLAGQVADIRALPEKWALRASTQYGRPDYRRIYNDCAADLLAVVASSPTTPEAKK